MDAWCIITACGVSAFTVDTHAILERGSGFLWDCLREGRVPKLAGLAALMLHYKMTENVVIACEQAHLYREPAKRGKVWVKRGKVSLHASY